MYSYDYKFLSHVIHVYYTQEVTLAIYIYIVINQYTHIDTY